MFTDRFIKVPIGVYDKKVEELTGKENTYESWMKFLPFELATYRPTYKDEEPDTECVHMILKCGDSTVVHLSIKEFEELLNKSDLK